MPTNKRTINMPFISGENPLPDNCIDGNNLQYIHIEESLSLVYWNFSLNESTFFKMPDCNEQDFYSLFVDLSDAPGIHHTNNTSSEIGLQSVAGVHCKRPGQAAGYTGRANSEVRGIQILIGAEYFRKILLENTNQEIAGYILNHYSGYLPVSKDLHHKLKGFQIPLQADELTAQYYLKGKIYMILSILITQMVAAEYKMVCDTETENLVQFNEALTQQTCQDIPSIAAAARQLNVSTSKFKELQKKMYLLSFAKYHREQRLGRAKKLLQDSQKRIKDIAYLTGFQSGGYFSRSFRQCFGMLPSDYQKIYAALA
ncbi:helix-turn-helix domain-containing protein [Taibaiella soli]|uniref:HTH araC/xylS-type domain-containing protein n=1 Tax=Taibaiella soli TaxID=1649169 RepID=A0A2W2A8U2_9BACT|nr:AraC family transcriptional regulator [Taibaiella soli]PZF71735.1 hypothetical protein DN068_16855 [Taibaiella soli]